MCASQGLRPCAPSGALHTPRTPVLIAIINRRAINAALSLNYLLYFYRNFRLPQAPRGSRFLRKLAPLRARRLRRPARRARGLKGVLYSTAAGAPPLRPVGCAPSGELHTPRTPVLIAIINRRVINAALSLSITYYISIGIFAFPKLRAARASCGSLRPCGRGGCAAPLAALGG